MDNYFNIYILKKVFFFLNDSRLENLAIDLVSMIGKVESTLDSLRIKRSNRCNENFYERKLAHYTSTEVSEFILKEKNNSLFRLNTIKNVNDPSEGQLLQRIIGRLSLGEEKKYSYKEDYHAFVGCFTFNHDSLNQFRLYGKKDNKEASGVSLVFNDTFFDIESITKNTILISNNIKSSDDTVNIPQQPVMRCVYIDPETNCISLAQKNKITFCREFLEGDSSSERAAKAWDLYQMEISDKTEEFYSCFESIKIIYESICTKAIELSKEIKEGLQELLDEILLPLKYLIKHAAFQEEQECRIIYITSLDDPKVKMDFGKFLYVEYQPEVKANLDKIYIAPAATQYQPYLAKLLCDTDVKIELSNNPFRLPTSH